MLSTLNSTQVTLVSALREIERELGGSFQIQADKFELGVGQEGRATTYLYELLDEEVLSEKLWFSNRLFNLGANNRLASSAIKEVRFVRFDMERADHSAASEEEIQAVESFFKANGARGGIRTPRGYHAYVILERALVVEPSGYSPLKDFCHWFLKDYKGTLVADTPSWSRSNVSRMVPFVSFWNDGATVEVPMEVQASWVEQPLGEIKLKKQVKGAVKIQAMQEGAGSLIDRETVSAILKSWCYGLSASATATACNCKVEKVEMIWGKYTKPELRAIKSKKDEKEVLTTDYTGKLSSHRKRRQKTFARFADRWWAYEDVYEELDTKDKSLLLDLVINCETFKNIKMNILDTYELPETKLEAWVSKDIDAQAKYTEEHETSTVSKEVLESVAAVLSVLPEPFTMAFLADALEGVASRRQILRAVKELGYVQEGNSSAAVWVKKPVEAVKTEEVAVKEKDSKDVEIANMIVEKNIKIEILHGPGGSGKTHHLEHEILAESVLLEGSLVPVKKIVDAKIMALSNQIVQELQFVRLKRKVETIHSGLHIPVDLEEMEDRKIRDKLVCIDEFGLVSRDLFWAILRRLSKNTRLVVLGDMMQLPPVNKDETAVGDYPLRDLIALAEAGHKQITVKHFTGNKRIDANSTGLLAAVENVRKGIVPVSGPGFTLEFVNDDAKYLGDKIMNRAANTVIALSETGEWNAASTLKGGDFGNSYGAQNIANRIKGSKEIKKGDEILCAVTDRRRNLTKNAKGWVQADIKYMYGEPLYGCQVQCLKNGKIKYLKRWLTRLEITRPECRNVHQLQGTQADNYVLVLERSRLMTREMLYTEISRGRKEVRLITTKDTLEECISTTVPYVESHWCKELKKNLKKS